MTRNARAQVGLFIGRRPETEKLYQAEDRASVAIREAALEIQQLFGWHTDTKDPGGWKDTDFWDKALPQELLSVLEHYESTASIAAARAYLESMGYRVVED